jgi:hypothetical protein
MAELFLGIMILFSPGDGALTEQTAKELAGYLGQLYQTEVRCTAEANPQKGKAVIAIGSAADAREKGLPELGPLELQIIVRKEEEKTVVLLRGGSLIARRAAVFRFLEHCGVLFGPMTDFLPDKQKELVLEPIEIREKAARPLFGPHYWLNFPMDPSSFSRADWDRLVRGWSRMGATVMGYHFFQGTPWYDVKMRDFTDQSGYFCYGEWYPLATDRELSYAIHNQKYFVSPDVEAFAEDRVKTHAWAQETVRQAMALAHELGMKNSLTFEPYGYGVPEPYLAKMKEWNGGQAVDTKDRLHPLMREYVACAIESILRTYPDLDILKLVSGEGAKREGTDEELQAYITELVKGDPTDSQGRAVSLPKGGALQILADALTSCKLAYEAVKQAREKGILREGLEIAIGYYPGNNLQIQPALFGLFGKVVPDPRVKLHILPAYGMNNSAEAIELADKGALAGRRLEISGWTELDGWMYVPQSWIHGIRRMNRVLETTPAEALYAIQWRTASTIMDNAYFVRSQWNAQLTPDEFWKSLTPLFGQKGVPLMREGMEKLEMEFPGGPFDFCAYSCWQAMLPSERGGDTDNIFGWPINLEKTRKRFEEIAGLFHRAGEQSPTGNGRRLAEYFANKAECGAIHREYGRLAAEAVIIAGWAAATHQTFPAMYQRYAEQMVKKSEEYLRHYQERMLDRTDEGMVASYYMTATRYAYRYAHPEEDIAKGKFYSGPPGAEGATGAQEGPEKILIIAPDIGK